MRKGELRKTVDLAREVLIKYPRNYEWMLTLAYQLSQLTDDDGHKIHTKENVFLQEAVELCERILEDCTIDEVRHSAIQLLCIAYPIFDKKDKAVSLAKTMPNIYVCRDVLLSHILSDEELLERLQSNIIQMIDFCNLNIWMYTSEEIIKKELSPQEIIKLYETSNKLYELIFETDDNYLFYNDRIFRNHYYIANEYARINNVEKALEHLLLAEKYANNDDNIKKTEKQTHTSLLTNRCFYDPEHISKNYKETQKQLLLKMIQDNSNMKQLNNVDKFSQLLLRLSTE